jgi:uncharacterized protein involved in exopolysaccharide biosynthesis
VLRLVNTVLRYRLVVGSCLVVGGVAAGLAALLSTVHYTAAARFSPQARRPTSVAGGLASQFGLALPGTDLSTTPGFYADLLSSRSMLEGVVDSRYSVPGDTGVETLVPVLEKGGATPADREAAIDDLRAACYVTTNARTGVVRIAVTMPYAGLARDVAQRFLDLLNAFNLKSRQSQASEERRFTQTQMEEARAALDSAEGREQQFLQRNREYRNSPELAFAYDRLAREVAMRQQVYTALVQSFEQARIEEVRDTPVITVVEPPEAPFRRDARGTIRKTALGLLLGGMLGFMIALWRDFVRQPGEAGHSALEEFLRLRAQVMSDLRHPLRTLRREVGAASREG